VRENDRNDQARTLPDGVAGPAIRDSDRGGNHCDLRDLSAGRLARAVPRGYVRDLMRHHSRQLGFIVGLENQAGVYKEKPAGQGEGVDLLGIQHLDRERYLGVGVAHQVLAEAVDVFGNYRIVDDLSLPLDLLRQLLSDRYLLFE